MISFGLLRYCVERGSYMQVGFSRLNSTNRLWSGHHHNKMILLGRTWVEILLEERSHAKL